MSHRELTDLLDAVAAAPTIQGTRELALRAIRALQAETMNTLRGTALRGLANLGTQDAQIYGARVRDNSPDARLVFGDKPVLVLSAHGELCRASLVRDIARERAFQTRYGRQEERWMADMSLARDEDLLVEDVGCLVRLVPLVLTRHLAAMKSSSEHATRVRNLATRVLEIVGG